MKNAYKYNQLVSFWNVIISADGYGGTYPKYQVAFDDYAAIVTKSEKRTLQESQIILDGYIEVFMRYRFDISITKNQNVKLKGKNYTIHSIENVNELDREFKLLCSESDENTELFEGENPYENYNGAFPYMLPLQLA